MKQNRPVGHILFWCLPLFFAAIFACGCRTEPASQEDSSPVLHCRYWQGVAPKIDGKLDEPGWEKAGHVPLRTTKAPSDGWARIAWDDQNLYIGFYAPDLDVTSTMQGHDKPYYKEDVVEIFLRPGKMLCYYEIQISPRGQILDQLVLAPQGATSKYRTFYSEVNLGIKTAGQVKGTINQSRDRDEGFTVEAVIPFAELKCAPYSPPKPGEVWRCHLLTGDSNKDGRIFRESSPLGSSHKIAEYLQLVFVEAGLLGDGRLHPDGPGTAFDRKWSLAEHLNAGKYTVAETPLRKSGAAGYKEAKGYCGIHVFGKSQSGLLNVHPGVRGRPLGVTLNIQGPQTLWLETHLAQKSADKVSQGRGDGVALTAYLRQDNRTSLVLPRTRILVSEKRWLRIQVPEGESELRLSLDCGPVNNWFDQTYLQLSGDGQAPSDAPSARQ